MRHGSTILFIAFGFICSSVFAVDVDVEKSMKEERSRPKGRGLEMLGKGGELRELADKIIRCYEDAKNSNDFLIELKNIIPEKRISLRNVLEKESQFKHISIRLPLSYTFIVYFDSDKKELLNYCIDHNW